LKKSRAGIKGSIAGFLAGCRDTNGAWHQLFWDGKEVFFFDEENRLGEP
jgi:hypothetical protein